MGGSGRRFVVGDGELGEGVGVGVGVEAVEGSLVLFSVGLDEAPPPLLLGRFGGGRRGRVGGGGGLLEAEETTKPLGSFSHFVLGFLFFFSEKNVNGYHKVLVGW